MIHTTVIKTPQFKGLGLGSVHQLGRFQHAALGFSQGYAHIHAQGSQSERGVF
jgi:hypothetical protein